MRKRHSGLMVFGLINVGLLLACSGGVGNPPDLGGGYENLTGAFERSGVSNQDPANPVKKGDGKPQNDDVKPGGGGGGNGGNGGSNPGGGDGCPPCDGTVSCEVTLTGGQPQRVTVSMRMQGGQCITETTGTAITFACGGAVLQGDNNIGTWKECRKGGDAPPAVRDAGAGGG
ncbi:MAG: hypothetical protein KF819_03010 [Labilithrix sp.]|nr:hypothetical protein [Labilithrix sp.]